MSFYTLGGGILGPEKQIQDRMTRYANFPDSQLQAIIRDYGGEQGEAARRVLEGRYGPGGVPPTMTIPTGTINVKLPSGVQPQVQLQPGGFSFSNPLVLAGIAALGLLFVMRKA